MSGMITYLDMIFRQWILALRTDWLTSAMVAITNLGSFGVVAGIVGCVSLIGILRRKYYAVFGFGIAVVGAHYWTEMLKLFFQRVRPPLPWLGQATGYSFPSGHSMVSMALYGYLAYFMYRNLKRSTFRAILMILLGMFPLAIGISRIYLGVHYPSDVLGGWTLGVIWLILLTSGMTYLSKRH